MPKTAPAKPQSLSEKRQQDTTDQLRAYYALGKKIQQIREKRGCDCRTAIGLAKSTLSETAAYKAWRFSQQVDDEELQMMLKPAQGQPLTCAHADALLSIKKRPKRLQRIRQATREGWSSAELRRQIGVINVARSATGRKFRLPSNRDEVYSGLQKHLRKPIRYLAAVAQIAIKGKPVLFKDDRSKLKELEEKIKEVLNYFQQSFQQK